MSKLRTASIAAMMGLFGATFAYAQQAQQPQQSGPPQPSTSQTEGTSADRTPPGATPTQGAQTQGVPSQSGSRILEDYRPPYTATVVEKLARAGAPLLGKTNQDEFAMGSSNENSAFGPVLNPWDRTRVPGGSSGGSAAAVAAGLAPWALGTDTGGSIRQPAALCGIVGLKPTYGRVSRYGLIAFASSLDHVSPFALDIVDTAHLLGAVAGHDPLDATSVAAPVPDYAAVLVGSVKGLRVGVPDDQAWACVYMASDEAGYLTGQSISPNGGDVMW